MFNGRTKSAVRLGVLGGVDWERSAAAAGFDVASLSGSVPATPDVEPQVRIGELVDVGERLHASLAESRRDMLLDVRGSGLSFVKGPLGLEALKLTHEAAGIPLVSYFDSSVARCMLGLPWATVWQVLMSKTWTKGVTDARHAHELRAFGIPGIVDVSAATTQLEGGVSSCDLRQPAMAVSYVGGSGLSEVLSVAATSRMESWIGMAAAAVGGYPEAPCFYDIYHLLYDCAPVPDPADAPEDLAEKAASYFRAKQRYLSELAFRARDRFVVFLSRKIGGQCRVHGAGWRDEYGVEALGMIQSAQDRAKHYQSAAINIGLPDPNSELGLDPRCLEVASAGGFLLCFHTHDIESYFEIGVECETFRDEQELLERIGQYLADPSRRMKIARAGQARVHRDHLIQHRVGTMVASVAIDPCRATGDSQADGQASLAGGASGGDGGEGAVAKIAADIDTALSAMGHRATPKPSPIAPPAKVVDGPNRLMVLLNPGKFTRYYLEDIASAAEQAGIETVRFEISTAWEETASGRAPNPTRISNLIRERNVKAVIGSGLNGVADWPCTRDGNGRPISLFEQLGVRHLLWWTDHPQWANGRSALRPELQDLLRSPNCRHFVKSELAARELESFLRWPHCHGVPVAENPDRLKPCPAGEPRYDVVAIVGSPPSMDPAFEPLLKEDRPDPALLEDIAMRLAGEKLQSVWDRDAPASMSVPLREFGEGWLKASRCKPWLGAFRHFEGLAGQHREAADYLRQTPLMYFDALEAMWQFGRWQRTFTLRYLSRFFSVGVFGSDWSGVGIPGGLWVEHEAQPGVYAQGRVAINISQAGEEEGVSHKPFQIAASGVPMVHLNRKGLADCFAPDGEVARFDTPLQAREQIDRLLADRPRAERMAAAARDRLCREHTWAQRLPQMLELAGVGALGGAAVRNPGQVQEMAAERLGAQVPLGREIVTG